MKIIENFLLPLVNERGIEPIVIKKANQFVFFMFGGFQMLNVLNFLGGAMSLDSFLKAYKTSETKRCFPKEWFNDHEKINNAPLLPYETFVSKLRNTHPLEKDYSDFQSLIYGSTTSKEPLWKLILKQPPATGQENYQILTSLWLQENMCTFKVFLR